MQLVKVLIRGIIRVMIPCSSGSLLDRLANIPNNKLNLKNVFASCHVDL